jgi:chemotaxis protein CheZ
MRRKNTDGVMTQSRFLLEAQFGTRLQALGAAMDRGDEVAFHAMLDDMLHSRKPALFGELRELTSNLQVALDRFRVDSRLTDIAEKDMPDARQRLQHVLKMTDEAAHKTMDLVEQSGPPAERVSRAATDISKSWAQFRARKISTQDFRALLEKMDAFLPSAQADTELVRKNLSEVLLTQGYQDLTGQIIRGVMQLVQELETALVDLTRLTSQTEGGEPREVKSSQGFGPVVPGVTKGVVASGQDDVDALLSGLGV